MTVVVTEVLAASVVNGEELGNAEEKENYMYSVLFL